MPDLKLLGEVIQLPTYRLPFCLLLVDQQAYIVYIQGSST